MGDHRCRHCRRILLDASPFCDSLCATDAAGRPCLAARAVAALRAWWRVRLRPAYPTR